MTWSSFLSWRLHAVVAIFLLTISSRNLKLHSENQTTNISAKLLCNFANSCYSANAIFSRCGPGGQGWQTWFETWTFSRYMKGMDGICLINFNFWTCLLGMDEWALPLYKGRGEMHGKLPCLRDGGKCLFEFLSVSYLCNLTLSFFIMETLVLQTFFILETLPICTIWYELLPKAYIFAKKFLPI